MKSRIWVTTLSLLASIFGFILGFGYESFFIRAGWWTSQWQRTLWPPPVVSSPDGYHKPQQIALLEPGMRNNICQDYLEKFPNAYHSFWWRLHLAQQAPDEQQRQAILASAPGSKLPFLLYQTGEELWQQGQSKVARLLLLGAAKRFSLSLVYPKVLYSLGKWEAQDRNWQAAQIFWQQTSKYSLTPEGRKAQILLPLTQHNQQQQPALPQLIEALWLYSYQEPEFALSELAPHRHPLSEFYQIQILWREKQWAQMIPLAKSYLQQHAATASQQQVAHVTWALAQSYQNQQQIAQAILYYQRYLDIPFPSKQRERAWICLGDCLVAQGQNQQARQAYRQTLEGMPNLHQKELAVYSIAWTFVREDNLEQAIVQFHKTTRFSSQLKWRGYYDLAKTYHKAGKLSQAVSTLQEALASSPEANWKRKYLLLLERYNKERP